MNKGFWAKLKKPVMVLAPMANVTDAAFRKVIAKYGKPDVFWTEFVSTDALCSAGKEKALIDFWFDKSEHPIVAQIFGSDPEKFYKSAKLIKELGFDGIDINMGCPDRSIEKSGGGAALIKKPELAKAIIKATKEGADGLPVSVKTRLGYNQIAIDSWLPHLLEAEPAVLTVHLRTRKEMSEVPAHWELMPEIMKLVEGLKERPLIFGNGDVKDLAEANEKVKQYGMDGVMIGRGIFGNPWLFNKKVKVEELPIEEKMEAMVEHTLLFEKMFKGIKPLEIMKKHYKAYVNGFEGAKEIRMELMNAEGTDEIVEIVKKHFPKAKV